MEYMGTLVQREIKVSITLSLQLFRGSFHMSQCVGVSKMIEPLYVISRYFVFSSLVQVICAKLLVGTPVFQYVVAHDEDLMP